MAKLAALCADAGLSVPAQHAVSTIASGTATTTQELAIPALSEHQHLAVVAPTGTGKTLVAAVAAALHLQGSASRPRHPRALILTPTRELTEQVSSACATVLEGIGARTLAFYGTPAPRRDDRNLARPVDCIVATPGRARELLTRGAICADAIGFFVLDEADHLLGPAFHEQTVSVTRALAPARTLSLSATEEHQLAEQLSTLHHQPPHFVRIATESSSPQKERTATVKSGSEVPTPGSNRELRIHAVVTATATERQAVLLDLLQRSNRSIVFVTRREFVESRLTECKAAGIPVRGLSGAASPTARRESLEAFRAGEAEALIATDIAARGLDIPEVTLIVHDGLPYSSAELVHRCGRTGRGSAPAGTVIALIRPKDRSRLRDYAASAAITVIECSDAHALATDIGRLRRVQQHAGKTRGPSSTPEQKTGTRHQAHKITNGRISRTAPASQRRSNKNARSRRTPRRPRG